MSWFADRRFIALLRVVLGIVFIVAALPKLADPIGFAEAALTLFQITGEEEFLSIARDTKLGPARTSNVSSLYDWVDDEPFQKGWHDIQKERKSKTSTKLSKN